MIETDMTRNISKTIRDMVFIGQVTSYRLED